MEARPRECATELLEVVPLIMRMIRSQVRSHSSPELSIPQFRALAFLGRNERAMLSDVSAFLGLTLPSASKLIDGVVCAGFATREIDPADRRRVALTLTPAGQKKYRIARRFAHKFLSERVGRLSGADRTRLLGAMESLRAIFAEQRNTEVSGSVKEKRTRRLLSSNQA
jgi:DNA-binding MarR family transcriptional regulator